LRVGRLICRAGGAACLAFVSGGAAATDWTLGGFLSETVDITSNRALDPDGDELSLGSTTRLTFDLTTATPRSAFGVTAGFSSTNLVGDDGGTQDRPFDPNVGVFYDYRLAAWTLGLSANASARSAAFNNPIGFEADPDEPDDDDDDPTDIGDAEDIGIDDRDATEFRGRIDGTARYAINGRQAATFGINYAATRFSESSDSLVETDRIGLSFGFEQAATASTRWNVRLTESYLSRDDEDDSATWTAAVVVGMNHTFNNRLNGFVSAGPNVQYSDRGNEDDVNFGATGSAGFRWQATPTTGFNMRASQNLATGDDGEQDTVASVSAGVSHAFDSSTSGVLQLSYSRQSADDTLFPFDANQESFNASPTINVALARNWNASAGYSLTLRREDDGDAVSNRVFVSVSTRF